MTKTVYLGKFVESRLGKISDARIKTRLIANSNHAVSEAELACLDAQFQQNAATSSTYLGLLSSDVVSYPPVTFTN